MDTIWEADCITAFSDDIEYMTSLGLDSNVNTAATDRTFYYSRGLKSVTAGTPLLVLLHGYPQT
jgi:hypothetical protein